MRGRSTQLFVRIVAGAHAGRQGFLPVLRQSYDSETATHRFLVVDETGRFLTVHQDDAELRSDLVGRLFGRRP